MQFFSPTRYRFYLCAVSACLSLHASIETEAIARAKSAQEASASYPAAGTDPIAVHKEAGRAAVYRHDLPRAVSELQQYVNLQTVDPEGHFWFAYALAETGNVNGALAEYQAAEEKQAAINMDCAEVRVNRGNLLMKVGRMAEAESEYRRAIAVDPLCTDAHLNLAQLLLLSNRVSDAFNQLGDCATTGKGNPKYYYLEGVANLRNGQTDSAVTWLRKCQVTSNQSQSPSPAETAIVMEAQKLLQFLNTPH